MAKFRINWALAVCVVIFVVYLALLMTGVLPTVVAEPGNWNDADPR